MIDWKKIIVNPLDSIRTTLLRIDAGSVRFALVATSDYRLLGTITDGDIRRALISGRTLEDKIEGVYNSSPYFVTSADCKEDIKKYLLEHSLLAAPETEKNIIVDVHSLESLSLNVKKKKSNPIFIMAGGFGTRLKPLTDKCPKPMLEVGGKPMLERLIEQFKSHGFYQFYISTHYLPEVIHDYFGTGEKWGVAIEYVHEVIPLGTGGALSLLPKDRIVDPLIMINGDVLTKLNFEALLLEHEKSGGIATMCVREYDYQIPYGVVASKAGKVIGFDEKPTYHFQVNAGIYVVEPGLLKTLQDNERIDMPTLLEKNFKAGVHAAVFHDYWLDIGKVDDFVKAQQDIKVLKFD